MLLLIRSGGRAGNNNCSSFIGSLVHARRPGGGRVGGQRASALSFRFVDNDADGCATMYPRAPRWCCVIS